MLGEAIVREGESYGNGPSVLVGAMRIKCEVSSAKRSSWPFISVQYWEKMSSGGAAIIIFKFE